MHFENFTGTFLYALVFVVIYLLAYFIFNGLLSFLIPGGGDYQNEVMRVMNDFVEDKKYDLKGYYRITKQFRMRPELLP